MTELLSLRDVGRRLGIAPHRIAYAHETGKLANVALWVAHKRVYTTDDVRRVAAYFEIDLKEKQGRTDGR